MKERILQLLEETVPLADSHSNCLYAELDSLGVTAILMALSTEYGIELEAADATPRNLKNVDTIVAMVKYKLEQKA